MKIITTNKFKHALKDIHKNAENRKFCFILGAGASFKSGIPTGSHLATEWFGELKIRLEKEELKTWMKEQNIQEDDLATSYGSIYRKRFEDDKTSGYEFLVQAMKTAKPSFGHIVLAQILSRTFGHCVLTTNFDSLVESSVYQFTNKTPLVCGHESLSGYARPSNTHPLIIKIHRDLLMAPKSDPDEISKLDPGWKEPLDHIFSTHIPIVIGYGGNDGSLMSYLETMNKPSNFFWCGFNENSISERTRLLIEKHEGSFVTINGFDELMHELLVVFDEIKPIRDELNEITQERIAIATNQLEEIIAKIAMNERSSDSAALQKELSALEYGTLANNEPDYEKRKKIYLEALKKYPTTGWLWWKFTYFLDAIKKDYDELDLYYDLALEHNKTEAPFLGNYAIFQRTVTKDYDKAEEYYIKSLAIDPLSPTINGDYAIFLYQVKKDYERAELFLKQALTFNPQSANARGSYAQLLLEIGENERAREQLKLAFDYNNTREGDLLLELWFYRYCHFPEFLEQAETQIELLLAKGIRSIRWDFSGNIEQALKEGHPYPEKLRELAERITSP